MGSTEDVAGPEPIAHPLGTAYLDGLLALSRSANWNQDADDWRHMLSAGRGWGLSAPDGTLLASTVALPYRARGGSDPFAWVSMVLVLPGQRRRGFASRLLREALAWLDAEGLTPVLDATPDGHPVYRREGFVDTWAFARHARAHGAEVSHMEVAQANHITVVLDELAQSDRPLSQLTRDLLLPGVKHLTASA